MTRIKQMWQQYPSKFWVIVVTTFIDVIGATLIFPFFALYITQRFNVGMTQAGLLLGTFSLASLAAFYALAVIVGLLADMAGPAQQAMVADILPEEQRAEALVCCASSLAYLGRPGT